MENNMLVNLFANPENALENMKNMFVNLLASTRGKVALAATGLGIIILVVLVITMTRKNRKSRSHWNEESNSISHTYDQSKIVTAAMQDPAYKNTFADGGMQQVAPAQSLNTAEPRPYYTDRKDVDRPAAQSNVEETIQPYGSTDNEETIQPYGSDDEETIQPYGDDSEETINPYDDTEETLPPAWEPPVVIRFNVDTREEQPFEKEVSFTDAMLIGRSQDCELCLAPKYISRRHLELSKTPEGVFIRNLSAEKSSRYTLLNQAELDEEERKLEDGDVLEISRTRVEFHIVGE